MTPKERLYACMEGRPVDKIPNLSIIILFAASMPVIPKVPFAGIIGFRSMRC